MGRALGYLTDRVLEDPSLNTREALQTLLAGWKDSEPASR